jgi:MGT family glycosyltransferase
MNTIIAKEPIGTVSSVLSPKKILFANIPGHGHFNPLIGLAVTLKEKGHDVRWYAGSIHHKKLKEYGIPYFGFKKAKEIDVSKLDELFPQRLAIKNDVKKLNFDLPHIFILRTPEFFEDIQEIRKDFPFDIMINDVSFTGFPLVKEKLGVPVLSIGIFPIMNTSKDLPPYGLAMTPSYTFGGRLKQNFLKFLTDKVLFKKSYDLYKNIVKNYGVEVEGNLFDIAYNKSTLVLQNGTPGFDYKRSDLAKNIRFLGPLFPPSKNVSNGLSFKEKIKSYKKVILVTQGTVEADVDKLITPTLEAFKNTDFLVIATTGGSRTEEVRTRYPQKNIIVEDFIPFDDVMPHCDVYVTNGGFGGVMYGIQNKLPLVVAGVHEGKNEICARVGYFKLGINLKTETPKAEQIKKAVEEVFSKPVYKTNVLQLAEEFSQYKPHVLIEKYIAEAVKLHQ